MAEKQRTGGTTGLLLLAAALSARGDLCSPQRSCLAFSHAHFLPTACAPQSFSCRQDPCSGLPQFHRSGFLQIYANTCLAKNRAPFVSIHGSGMRKRHEVVRGRMQLQMVSIRARDEIDQRDIDALAALATELRTDDGFVVAEFTRRSRPTWATEFLTTLSSRVLGRISQRLTWTMAWACYVTALITAGDYIAPTGWGSFTQFTVPGWPHELIGGFLSILLVFRTDQAYDRFWESRGRWAQLGAECRALERLLLTTPVDDADRSIAYLAIFPVALKQHLRGERNLEELAAIYRIYQPSDGREEEGGLAVLADSKNIPMTILYSLSQLAAPLRESGRGDGFEVLWEEVESRLGRLTEVVSECETIKCTPLPLSYSRHTSRFFSLYTLSLPFALVKETSPLLVPTIVVITSWVLFATEEIGRLIEDPFAPGIRTQAASRFIAQEMSREDIVAEFENLDEDGDGLLYASQIVERLASNASVMPFNATAQQVDTVLGAMGMRGRSFGFEEFRLMWSFLGGGARMMHLEALPLEKFCVNINREMFFLWLLQGTHFNTAAQEPQSGVEEEEEEEEEIDGQPPPATWSMSWSKAEVGRWLVAEGYGQYRREFLDNDIDGKVLAVLTTKDLGMVGVRSLGQRKRLLDKISALVQSES